MTVRSLLTSLVVGALVGVGVYLLVFGYRPSRQMGKPSAVFGLQDTIAEGIRLDPIYMGCGAGLVATGIALMVQRPRPLSS